MRHTGRRRSTFARYPSFWAGCGLLLIMALPVIISRLWLADQSLRLDESQSIWQVSHSIQGLLHVVAQDVHVPLYHLILHGWIELFGNAPATVRAVSLLFFEASLPIAYLICRMAMKRGWALAAVLSLAISPFFNWYANEARMYTMLLFMVLLSQYFFLRLLRSGKGWIGFAITAVIGMYTHYFFAFSLLTQGIFYLINRRKFPKWSFVKFISIAVLVGVAMVPWLALFISQGAGKNERPLLVPPSSVDFFNVYSQFLIGFHGDFINTIFVSCWPLVMVVAFFVIKRGLRFGATIGYLLMTAIFPVVLSFGLSFVVTPFFLSRYMMASAPACLILVVWLISRYKGAWMRVVLAGFIGLLVIASYLQITGSDVPVKEDYRGAAAYISARVQPQDIVVLSSPFTVYPFEYYYTGEAQIRTIPDWDRAATGGIPPFTVPSLAKEITNLKTGHQYMYVLLSYDQGYQKKVKNYLDQHLEMTGKRHFVNDIDLYIYRLGYYQPPALTDHPIR